MSISENKANWNRQVFLFYTTSVWGCLQLEVAFYWGCLPLEFLASTSIRNAPYRWVKWDKEGSSGVRRVQVGSCGGQVGVKKGKVGHVRSHGVS